MGAVVAQLPWVDDQINSEEERLLLEEIAPLSIQNLELTRQILEYPWIADNITNIERESVGIFRSLLDMPGVEDSGLVENLVGSPWVSDGLIELEREALAHLLSLLETAENLDFDLVNQLSESSWFTEVITNHDINVLWGVIILLELSDASNSDLAEKLLGYPWITNGIIPNELNTLHRINEILDADAKTNSGFVDQLSEYPWLYDGVNDNEYFALIELRRLLEIDEATNSAFVKSLSEYPWMADDLNFSESLALHSFYYLVDNAEESTRAGLVKKLASYPWIADGITVLEGSVLGKIIRISEINSETALKLWLDDGIDDEDYGFMTVLQETKSRSLNQYQDLLESHHTRSKAISLPLAGDVKLLVFRHNPFPPDDDSIELMEDIAQSLEEFMQVPFPWNPVIVNIIEPSLDSGEEPEHGVAFSLSDLLVITARKYNPDFHLSVFHEMSHIYWGGHTGAPPWFTEGAAGFLPDYAREVTGVQTIEERRKDLIATIEQDCFRHGVGNIRQLKLLKGRQPEEYEARGICHYAFGEFFLMETYRLLGRDATSAAMRELYLQNEATGLDVSEPGSYRAFLSNAPPGKKDAFR